MDINENITINLQYSDGYIHLLDELSNEMRYEIIGATESEGVGFSNGLFDKTSKTKQPLINNSRIYKRIFIKKI